MPHAGLSATVARARRAVVNPEPRSDGQLLTAFLASQDADAFAELVTRFGPMVFAVCRKLTGHHQDAEDAFQATFVVLARKAAVVAPREAVGNWLYGVAVRIAREARAVSARRREREVPTAQLPDIARPDPAPDDAPAVLHEELAELPDKFRTLLVLCDLRGEAQTAVAERLGLPVGTVYSRLSAARKALAERLRKRGLALPAVGLAALAHATVPPRLLARTVAVALPGEAVPATVAALSHGVLRLMFAQKLKIAIPFAAVVLGALAFAALAGPPAPQLPPVKPVAFAFAPQPDPVPKAAAKPLPKGPNKLLFWHNGKLVMADPDGKNERKFAPENGEYHFNGGRLSPDGRMIATLIPLELPNDPLPGERPPLRLYVRKLDDASSGTYLGVECDMFAWSPDGTELVCTAAEERPEKVMQTTSFVVDVKTKKKTELKLPEGHMVTDWTADGRFLTTNLVNVRTRDLKARLYLVNRDGTKPQAITGEKDRALFGRISPDGTRVLFTLIAAKEETADEKKKREDAGGREPDPEHSLAVLDVATGKIAKVQDLPLNAELQKSYCWSPDGKKIAYTWREKALMGVKTESHLVVCDADGKNANTIASQKNNGPWAVTLAGVDWR